MVKAGRAQWLLVAAVGVGLTKQVGSIDAPVDQYEHESITELYKALNIKRYEDKTHCEWPGVACQEMGTPFKKRITEIRLSKLFKGRLGSVKLPPEIKQLPELLVLDLSDTGVQGDLMSFTSLKKLQRLRLRGTKIGGKLLRVKRLKNLLELDAASTQITGALKDLALLSNLKYLLLSNSAISGNLEALANLPRLTWLYLYRTDVDGDLKALSGLRGLQRLDMAYTRISGDLSAIENLEFLQMVYLTGSGVSGKLASVAPLAKLDKIGLAETKVSGNIAVLAALTDHLRWLNLSHTAVEGKIQNSWAKTLTALEELDVAGTKIQLGLEQTEDSLAFPALSWLDVSSCPLKMPVMDVLNALSRNTKLTRLYANDAGLTSSLMLRHGSLVELRLSDNEITEVDIDKGMTQLKSVDLAGNKLKKVSDQVWGWEPQKGNSPLFDLRRTGLQEEDFFAAMQLMRGANSTENEDSRTSKGYRCFDAETKNGVRVLVDPETFAPNALCECIAGFKGSGISCKQSSAGEDGDDGGSNNSGGPTGKDDGEGGGSYTFLIILLVVAIGGAVVFFHQPTREALGGICGFGRRSSRTLMQDTSIEMGYQQERD